MSNEKDERASASASTATVDGEAILRHWQREYGHPPMVPGDSATVGSLVALCREVRDDERRRASAPQCECSEAVDGDPPCPVHPRETADNKRLACGHSDENRLQEGDCATCVLHENIASLEAERNTAAGLLARAHAMLETDSVHLVHEIAHFLWPESHGDPNVAAMHGAAASPCASPDQCDYVFPSGTRCGFTAHHPRADHRPERVTSEAPLKYMGTVDGSRLPVDMTGAPPIAPRSGEDQPGGAIRRTWSPAVIEAARYLLGINIDACHGLSQTCIVNLDTFARFVERRSEAALPATFKYPGPDHERVPAEAPRELCNGCRAVQPGPHSPGCTETRTTPERVGPEASPEEMGRRHVAAHLAMAEVHSPGGKRVVLETPCPRCRLRVLERNLAEERARGLAIELEIANERIRERDQPGESAEALSVDCASPAVVQPAPSGSPTDGTTSRAAPNASVAFENNGDWVPIEQACRATSPDGEHECTRPRDHKQAEHHEVDPVFGTKRARWGEGVDPEPCRGCGSLDDGHEAGCATARIERLYQERNHYRDLAMGRTGPTPCVEPRRMCEGACGQLAFRDHRGVDSETCGARRCVEKVQASTLSSLPARDEILERLAKAADDHYEAYLYSPEETEAEARIYRCVEELRAGQFTSDPQEKK